MLPAANVWVALAAAASWGGGDFSGGMGVKATDGSVRSALRFVVLAHAISLAALLLVAAMAGVRLPHGGPVAWGVVAGVSGGLSLVAFYIALSRGAMGASAAVSGLLAAALPAVVSVLTEGRPTGLRTAGFLLAAVAIWLIAAGPVDEAVPRSTMVLAVLGGLGFGVYFIALRFANPLGLVMPLVLARVASIATCSVLVVVLGWSEKQTQTSPRYAKVFLWACGVAVLDTGGNALFLLATRLGRLDVAAVLASLYPASTILLAAWRLKERPARRQWVGMAVALGAVVLVTV